MRINYANVISQNDKELKEIRKKIYLSMNGIVSEKMEEMGVKYRINYGVDIPRLRQIASQYQKNEVLANRLWLLKIRETMILATLLHPIESFTVSKAENWLAEVVHLEMCEQLTMNLLSKVRFAKTLCSEWITTAEKWHSISAYLLLARIYDQMDEQEIIDLLPSLLPATISNDLIKYQSIALALMRFCRKSPKTAEAIIQHIGHYSSSEERSKRYIWNAVRQEVDFLT